MALNKSLKLRLVLSKIGRVFTETLSKACFPCNIVTSRDVAATSRSVTSPRRLAMSGYATSLRLAIVTSHDVAATLNCDASFHGICKNIFEHACHCSIELHIIPKRDSNQGSLNLT